MRMLHVPYEEYFGKMDITESQAERRIRAAEDVETVMLIFLALLSVQKEHGTRNYGYAEEFLEGEYRKAAMHYTDAGFAEWYAPIFAAAVADASMKNEDDEWYVSDDRAMLVAENEANALLNHAEYEEAVAGGYARKQWIDVRDGRERKTHLEVGRQAIPIDGLFIVGKCVMRYPKDMEYAYGHPEETANCRCSIRYLR